MAAEAETSCPEPGPDQANVSSLVKEIVKDMDGDELLSKPDVYDESAEVGWHRLICYFVVVNVNLRDTAASSRHHPAGCTTEQHGRHAPVLSPSGAAAAHGRRMIID